MEEPSKQEQEQVQEVEPDIISDVEEKVVAKSPSLIKKKCSSPKKRVRIGAIESKFSLEPLEKPTKKQKKRRNPLGFSLLPGGGILKKKSEKDPKIEKKDSGERRRKKDGVNRKFLRKNAKKGMNQKKKKEANNNNTNNETGKY